MVDYPITLLCLFFFYNTCFNSRQIRLGDGEGRNSLIFPLQVYGAPKDVVFALFWSENGYRLCLFWSEFGYGFWGNTNFKKKHICRFNSKRKRKKRVISEFEIDFKQSFCQPSSLSNDNTGADPGFLLRGGALFSCSTSTPINHIVFFFCRIPVVLENHRSSQGGCTPPAPSP